MSDINLIKKIIEEDRFEFYGHALTESKKDGIEPEDIISVLLTGKIIEEYPDRNRVLIYGRMDNGIPLHVVCDLSDEEMMYVVTSYIPQNTEWIRSQIRKRRRR